MRTVAILPDLTENAHQIRVPAPGAAWRGPCHSVIGKMPRIALAAIPALLLAVTAAADPRPEEGPDFHLRTTDAWLLSLIEEGVRTSPTFRALVERLDDSDVIVYLQGDSTPAPNVDGRMTFASKAGGYRYIVVRLRTQSSRRQMLALLGHELRHAVEVADTPAIVDSTSLAREYERLGYVQRWNTAGVAFDTHAAIEAGYQVLAELSPRHPRGRRGRRLTMALSVYDLSAGTELAP